MIREVSHVWAPSVHFQTGTDCEMVFAISALSLQILDVQNCCFDVPFKVSKETPSMNQPVARVMELLNLPHIYTVVNG